jgi:ABC-type sugar transport system ATPase subunit
MTDTQELCVAILGTNGTGKSTQVARMVAAHVKKGGRALIVTPDDREWPSIPMVDVTNRKKLADFKGTRKTIFLKGETLESIQDNYTNGMLIFDDCRAYLTSSVGLELHYLLIRRRQAHTNMVFVAHGFTDLIPKIFTFATHIILFKTRDNIAKRKGTIRDFEAMEAAVERVNYKANSNHHYFEIIPQ